ncbi:DUF1460 domain-containing protein [Alteromonas sediminis]|uniref:DUF1460 domain-containing protein n=1 Tax=Alteromonas sediminis TaxID=2259342 RepID=A0A3N5YQR1_9ALTE|nr:N-acetylmuramoyl-L-alanine amidase-like domain-containing protein [Alteromonas sediminis]RPJ68571.1 DUF1460 domain-containing protein [Alteromonas sediminis]
MQKASIIIISISLLAALLSGCDNAKELPPLTSEEIQIATDVGITPEEYQVIKHTQLYELSPRQTDQYLQVLHQLEPDLRERIGMIAEKNIGQPYDIYLLGEAPFEPYDAQPLFELSKSDCVVFAEHTYAMGLSDNWGDFFTTLQHIRYNQGEVSVVTRNHFTEYDWNINNRWLVEDITDIAGADTMGHYKLTVNKERFFAKQFGIDVPVDEVTIDEVYVANAHVDQVAQHLSTGDLVNFVRGKGEHAWVGHVGVIKVEEDGTVNVIHSAEPAVRKEGLIALAKEFNETAAEREAEGKSATLGFKFLRLREQPISNLAEKFDGAIPPIVMRGRKHTYLTQQQVEDKLSNM